MPNKSTDALFQLIHSLQKSEKRNFKLYIKRNSSRDDLKVITLFDALDKQSNYDENALIRKNPTLTKQQLANLKAHLYRQILSSLMLLQRGGDPVAQFYEQMDFAKILYKKGLYHQSLRILDKLKENAKNNLQMPFLIEILDEEKKIETLHITRSLHDRADELTAEAKEAVDGYGRQTKLSNLALALYGWYIKNGMARNEREVAEITEYFKTQLTDETSDPQGFYEKLYYYQSYCWFGYIRQDFLMYYRYSRKWVEIFHEYPNMLELETGNYIKGMHNLLTAHFSLRNFKGFEEALNEFEKFSKSELATQIENNRIQVFVYLYISKINKHFQEGTFEEGLQLVDYITNKLSEYELYLDKHRTLIFYYKIASLYFGAGKFDKAIEFLNKIINWKVNLRSDLQCYARLLHLIAHYELGNEMILEYLIKSVYRFMAKMENLSKVEEAIFAFLRRSFHATARNIQPELIKLLNEIKSLEHNKFETRAFVYLDILSWLESKIHQQQVSDVIRQRFLEGKRFED